MLRVPWVRSVALRLAAYPLIAYLTACAFLYLEQSRFLFPAPATFETITPASRGLEFGDLRISVNPSDSIHAWWIPSDVSSQKAVLVFHGNGYVLESTAVDEATRLHAIGTNLLLLDYRGYGLSTPIAPNEVTIDEDAESALNYLFRDRALAASKVYLLGRSIGSGPATYLAERNPGLGGLILESPFSSIEDAAAESVYLRIFPLALILRTHFANLKRISRVHCPLLIVSGTADTLTPAWMAKKIFAQANKPKQLYLVSGAGHNDLIESGADPLTQVLRAFVAR